MTQKKYRVTGKDRFSDQWTTQDFDTAEEAQEWAENRAWLLYPAGAKDPVQTMEVSDR